LLNVIRLIGASHWNSCNSWQINHSKIRTSWRVNCQNNWFIYDILTLSTNLIR
jgi:hypothetical protein